jgi:signal transduction histidine kinase
MLAWVFLPAGEAPPDGPWMKRLRGGRAAIEVALGTGLMLLAVLLLFRSIGLWFSDAVVWPLVLVTSGGALIWRQSLGGHERRQAVAEQAAPPPTLQPHARDVSRTGLGVALVIAAGFAFLQATGTLGAARDVLVAALVVTIVLGVILAPWVVRLVRSLGAERSERIRTQERAEMAAHLHDSVLQTLALMQKQADDPRAIATLARRQERELRAWLSGRTGAGSRERRLGPALEQAAEEVEAAHGIPVEVIAVGESETLLDDSGEALVAAAREAMMNAAKHGGGGAVNVYAEAGSDSFKVFVGDRGDGFDVGSIPDDRRGVRESIIGRMERHGGHADIRSAPEKGTEVELTLDRPQEAPR